jgi:antibiotic biosynthesis monooxygenase (ABM) superfamily enzyme
MIRAIYRWWVLPEHQADFLSWWHEGTVRIRSSKLGARGSTILSAGSDRNHYVAIARWESLSALTAFWNDPGGVQFEDAELVSVEVLEEIDHLTVEEP